MAPIATVMPIIVSSCLSSATAPLNHAWEHTVGSGRALLALRADWREQLRRCHGELGFRYVRFHGLLDDDMGTLIAHQEKPLYSFFNADCICDFLLSIGMRPFVELGFMPEMLASGPETVFHFRGNVTPPADYDAWATLVRTLVGHWVDRYGIDEVRQWFFEVWNEPNLPAFWTGTREDYFTLYGHTAQAIKTVGASLRVGGQATAMTAWIDELLDYGEKNRLPVDFISTHIYPTDPLGFEGADTEEQLANLHGVPKPIYRAFQLLHGLGRERLPVAGAHETVDAWVVRNGRSITVFLTNHAQPRHAIATELVDIRLTDAPAPRAAYIERIDENHANPRRQWREMGEPEYPSRAQVEQLEAASRLVKEPLGFAYENRTIRFDVDLPPHAVAAVTLELAPEPPDRGATARAATIR